MKLSITIPSSDSIKTYFFRLLHSCEFGDTFLYWFYEFIVRTLECKCCIFYRGFAIGIVAGMLWTVLLVKFIWSIT